MKFINPTLIATILLFAILGCDDGTSGVETATGISLAYEPTIRLVKDGASEYHFQWDEPLKEGRIIIAQYQSYNWIRQPSDDSIYGVIVGVEKSSYIDKTLWYFPKDSFRSQLFTDMIAFVEILSPHERNNFPLPNHAIDATGALKNQTQPNTYLENTHLSHIK